VASSKDRERKLARAKLERQMARRAAKARAQRQLQARIGVGVAVLLILGGVVFALNLGGHHAKKPVAAALCTWNPVSVPSAPASPAPSGSPSPSASAAPSTPAVNDVGTPPTTGIANTGFDTMTLTTGQGVITAELDISGTPCGVESLSFLASQGFYDNQSCDRLTVGAKDGILYCGTQDPAYTFDAANIPYGYAPSPGASPRASNDTTPPNSVVYPAGTIALDNNGPGMDGGRFFIVYKDTVLPTQYSVVGNVTSGLDMITNVIAKGGVTPGASATDGKPKVNVAIDSVTIGPASSSAPSASPSSAS